MSASATLTRGTLSRRAALQMLAAGAASLAAGCSPPDEAIVAKDTLEELPYVNMPEGLVPGITQAYATALPLAGYARGALVTSFEGRPIKVEGNPHHPASLGATDVFAQAEILSLYDPDRSQAIRVAGEISDWPAFESALRPRLAQHAADKGATLRLLTGRVTSPTLLKQIRGLQAAFPKMRRHVFEPSDEGSVVAAQAVYGRPIDLRPRLDDADVVVAFNADPLGPGPDQVRFGRALIERRKRDRASCRLYAAESTMSLTGAAADHRAAAAPDAIEAMIAALASALGAPIERPTLPPDDQRFIDAVAKDVQAHSGRALVMVGPSLPNAAPLGLWINDRIGAPIDGFDSDPQTAAAASLAELAQDIRAGRVETLVTVDSNPVATAPGDLDFEALIKQPPFRIHLGAYFDETAAASTWHLPGPHPLESWSDIAATDGVVSIVQPLIRPLHDSYSAHRLLAALASEPQQSDYERIRATWRSRWGEQDFGERWRQALIAGVVPDTAKQPIARPSAKFPGWTRPTPPAEGELTAIFRIDPSVFDGRYANNAWLQECPQPFSQAVWGNAVQMSLADAKRLRNRGRRRGRSHVGEPVDLRADAPGDRARRRNDRAFARLRPHARRCDRGRRRLQRRRPAIVSIALDRTQRVPPQSWSKRTSAAFDRGPVPARRQSSGARAGNRGWRCDPAAQAAPELQPSLADTDRRPLRLGHGDRHGGLHRMQRLRRRVPVGEQRAGDRPGGDRPRPRHALASD